MVRFADMIYYNVLVKFGIIVAILGLILFILVISFYISWSNKFTEIGQASFDSCVEKSDCFEWCGECRSARDQRLCESAQLSCDCVNRKCIAVS